MSTRELVQFQYSHYNEKARWALDYKGLPHRRRSLLPGPHAIQVRRLSGQVQVPVLRDGAEVVTGSSEIVDHLERLHPDPPLYPADPDARARAFAIRDEFDSEVGPAVRVALFQHMLPDAGYLARMFSTGQTWLTRSVYRAMMPAVAPVMKRSMEIGPDNAARGADRTRAALDFVAERAGPDGYLVAERFSVADLTAASLLMVTCYPPGLQPALPEPRSPRLGSWLDRWADHPGTAWVREMYRRHRGASAELPRP